MSSAPDGSVTQVQDETQQEALRGETSFKMSLNEQSADQQSRHSFRAALQWTCSVCVEEVRVPARDWPAAHTGGAYVRISLSYWLKDASVVSRLLPGSDGVICFLLWAALKVASAPVQDNTNAAPRQTHPQIRGDTTSDRFTIDNRTFDQRIKV